MKDNKADMVRRSAELFLFDPEDIEVMFAKYGINGIWTEEQMEQHNKVGKAMDRVGIEKPEWFNNMEMGKPRGGGNLDHRRMSNNSMGFIEKPSEDLMDLVFEVMQLDAEPGFINLGEAAERVLATLGNTNPTKEDIADKAYELGLNPCQTGHLQS